MPLPYGLGAAPPLPRGSLSSVPLPPGITTDSRLPSMAVGDNNEDSCIASLEATLTTHTQVVCTN